MNRQIPIQGTSPTSKLTPFSIPVEKRHKLIPLLALLLFSTLPLSGAQLVYEPYTFKTIAGKAGVFGFTDGPGPVARFYGQSSPAILPDGTLYIPDLANHSIRQIRLDGGSAFVTTVAGMSPVTGSADGTNETARFNFPAKIALAHDGSLIIADRNNNTIRRMYSQGTNWVVTTVAGKAGVAGTTDGTNSFARFNFPVELAINSKDETFIVDYNNNRLRKLTHSDTNWIVTTVHPLTLSPTGSLQPGSFSGIDSVGVGVDDNLFIVQTDHTLRQLVSNGTNWIMTVIAGAPGQSGSVDGPGKSARFSDPESVAVDASGNVYVGDWGDYTVRKASRDGTNWTVRTIGGSPKSHQGVDGIGVAAHFYAPNVAVDKDGALYVSDSFNYTVSIGLPALSIATWKSDFGISGSSFQFDLVGGVAPMVWVEASMDFRSWELVSTSSVMGPLFPPTVQKVPFSTNPRAQFFRIRQLSTE